MPDKYKRAKKIADATAEKISELDAQQFRNKDARVIAEMERADNPIRMADELARSHRALNQERIRQRERGFAMDAYDETYLRNQSKMLQRALMMQEARQDKTKL